jgi:hypothetical protein
MTKAIIIMIFGFCASQQYIYINGFKSPSPPGPNPTIVSYNTSVEKTHNANVVKNYNATGSLVRFENKKSSTLKNALAFCDAGVVVVKFEVVGGVVEKHDFRGIQRKIPHNSDFAQKQDLNPVPNR